MDSINILNESEVVDNHLEVKPNTLVLGNCLKVMQYIPEKSVDMILCDLPYG